MRVTRSARVIALLASTAVASVGYAEASARSEQQPSAQQQQQQPTSGPQSGQPAAAEPEAGQDREQQNQRQTEQDRQQTQQASPQQQQPTPRQQPAGATAAAATTADIEDLRDDPDRYEGMTVRIEGDVEDVLGPRMLKVSQNTVFDLFDDDVLVYAPDALAIALRKDAPVTITGTFQTFTDINVEEELGWFEPEPDVEAEFNRRHVIVATSIESEGRNPVLTESNAAAFSATGGAEITTLTALADDDDDLAGRRVRLTGTIGQTIGSRTFTLGTGDERVLAVVAFPLREQGTWSQHVKSGASVRVSGVVLESPDLDLPESAEPSAHDIFNDRDVYIYVTSVEPAQQ